MISIKEGNVSNAPLPNLRANKKMSLELEGGEHFNMSRITDLFRGNKRDQVIKRSGTHCFFCEAPLGQKVQADHLIPVDKGGETTLENGQMICTSCNLSKGTKMPSEYFKSIGWPNAKCIRYTGTGRDGRCGQPVPFGKGEYCRKHRA